MIISDTCGRKSLKFKHLDHVVLLFHLFDAGVEFDGLHMKKQVSQNIF